MKMTWDTITRVLAAVGGFFAALLGGWDSPLQALLIFMAVDYGTGLLLGLCKLSPKTEGGGISSKVSLAGIYKKVAMLGLVAIGAALDRLLGGNNLTRTGIVYFLIANEGLSILENYAKFGLWVPPFLKDALEQLKGKGEKPPDDDTPLGI